LSSVEKRFSPREGKLTETNIMNLYNIQTFDEALRLIEPVQNKDGRHPCTVNAVLLGPTPVKFFRTGNVRAPNEDRLLKQWNNQDLDLFYRRQL
jgi:hypothetical protein